MCRETDGPTVTHTRPLSLNRAVRLSIRKFYVICRNTSKINRHWSAGRVLSDDNHIWQIRAVVPLPPPSHTSSPLCRQTNKTIDSHIHSHCTTYVTRLQIRRTLAAAWDSFSEPWRSARDPFHTPIRCPLKVQHGLPDAEIQKTCRSRLPRL